MTTKLSERRKEKGISTHLLAEQTGISYNTLRQIDTGVRDFSTLRVDRALKIADTLECDIEDLLETKNITVPRPEFECEYYYLTSQELIDSMEAAARYFRCNSVSSYLRMLIDSCPPVLPEGNTHVPTRSRQRMLRLTTEQKKRLIQNAQTSNCSASEYLLRAHEYVLQKI